MARLGPALAMLAAMYGGNTLPDEPSLAYPWWALALLTLATIGSLAAEHRGRRPVLWGIVGHIAAIGTVALVPIHLVHLVGLTGSGQ